MAINERSVEKVRKFLGQKSGQPLESYGFDSGTNITGFTLKEGQLQRVSGGNIYAEILPDQLGGITSLHRFKSLWVAQRGVVVAIEDSEASASFTSIKTDLASVEKLYSSQWRDRIFFNNAQNAFFHYRNANIVETASLGIDAPDSTTAIVNGWDSSNISSAAAGNVVDGTYYYVFTLYDENTNSESPAVGSLSGADGLNILSNNDPFSGIVAPGHTVTGGPKTVRIANLDNVIAAVSALVPRATHFIVYRAQAVPTSGLPGINGALYGTFNRVPQTSSDGPTIIRISTFVAAGVDFVDNTANLVAVSLPENNSPPPTPERMLKTLTAAKNSPTLGVTDNWSLSDYSAFRHTKFFRDQLFGIGAVSPGFKLNASGVAFGGSDIVGNIFDFQDILHGSEVYQPDYWPYVWEVGRGDGQTAIGLGVLGDTALLLFKEKSTYYLSGSSPSDFVVRILDTNKGCVNESTIQETPIGVICLDRTGFVLFNKIGQGERISTDIQDVIDSILFPYSSSFYSWYDPKDQRYYCAVVIPGSQTPNLTLCLDLESMQWTTDTSLVGLSRLADTDSDGEYVELIGSKTNGRLVDLSNPEIPTFQDGAIYSSWTSGVLSFGDDQHKKKMRWLYLKVKAAGDWTVTIEIVPDFREDRKFTITVNYSSEQETWFASDGTGGTLYWDEGVWAFDGPEKSQVKIPIICKGRLFQVRVINQDTAANRWGFAIEGISAEAVMLDK